MDAQTLEALKYATDRELAFAALVTEKLTELYDWVQRLDDELRGQALRESQLRDEVGALAARVHLIAATFADLEREHSVRVEPQRGIFEVPDE